MISLISVQLICGYFGPCVTFTTTVGLFDCRYFILHGLSDHFLYDIRPNNQVLLLRKLVTCCVVCK